jgi:hypothetical protein
MKFMMLIETQQSTQQKKFHIFSELRDHIQHFLKELINNSLEVCLQKYSTT